ncbi:MAG: branched-chain amino acid ABC transporter permease [Gammaproteobacteria bacterium]|nr:MAG: branched-chain amino acid ABC transporter permease [Gammaproteobacteria bacterium]
MEGEGDSVFKALVEEKNLMAIAVVMLLSLFSGLVVKLAINGSAETQPELIAAISSWLKVWLELTVAGILMGFVYFLLSAGMTIVFGLMGVFNLAHGAFIATATFVFIHIIYKVNSLTRITETRMVSPLPGVIEPSEKLFIKSEGWFYDGSAFTTILIIFIGVVIVSAVIGMIAFVYERYIVRLVYGNTTLQMLITLGGAVVLIELLMTTYGARTPGLRKPALLFGHLQFLEFWDGGVGVLRTRILGGAIGMVVFVITYLVLMKTKVGILIRAGVENKEMLEAQGYNIKRLFVLVFIFANIIAAIGGSVYSLNGVSMTTDVSNELLLIVIAAIMIGGVGSVKGCLVGSVLIALVHNYMSAIYPPLSGQVSVVMVMLAVLLWQPRGLNPLESNGEQL